MTAHAEPIKYLDSILNEEEKRCEYNASWRNFTISRSGRFKTKNKKREAVDGKMFDASPTSSSSSSSTSSMNNEHCHSKEQDKISGRVYQQNSGLAATINSSTRNQRDKKENYKSFYETNL